MYNGFHLDGCVTEVDLLKARLVHVAEERSLKQA